MTALKQLIPAQIVLAGTKAANVDVLVKQFPTADSLTEFWEVIITALKANSEAKEMVRWMETDGTNATNQLNILASLFTVLKQEGAL